MNSTGDGADADTGDGVCDDGAGNCTLRAAIEQANTTAGLDNIHFNISGTGPHFREGSLDMSDGRGATGARGWDAGTAE